MDTIIMTSNGYERLPLPELNPCATAQALLLFAFNLSPSERVTAWWGRRFPGQDLDSEVAMEWVAKFSNRAVPLGLDEKSMHAYVSLAIETYGPEAERRYPNAPPRRESADVA